MVHMSDNGVWYFNQGDQREYHRVNVREDEVYEVKREYYTSKHNHDFSRTIITVKAVVETEERPFSIVMYRWAAGADKIFIHPRHGNSSNLDVASISERTQICFQRSILCSRRAYQLNNCTTTLPECRLLRSVRQFQDQK